MRLLACLAIIASAGAAPAFAQTAGEVFVGGRAAVDIQRHPDVLEDGNTIILPDLSGAGASGSILGGVFLSNRVAARLELGWSGERQGGSVSSLPAPGFGTQVTTRVEQRHRMMTALAMLSYHLPSRTRWRVVLLGGATVARQRARTAIDLDVALPPVLGLPPGFELPGLSGVQSDRTATTYRAGVALGVDADWSVRPRLTISPGIRVLTVGSILSVQPGVAARWTF